MTEKNDATEEQQDQDPKLQPEVESEETGESRTEEVSVADLEAKAAENWDLYLRSVAELENVRRRASRDLENAHKFSVEKFAREMLAVKDSLEMGLEAGDGQEVTLDTLMDGSKITLKILIQALEKFDVVEVDPLGEPFDPAFHEALSMQESDEAEPGSVVLVIQKGYRLHDRLLRPARVIVAKAVEHSEN